MRALVLLFIGACATDVVELVPADAPVADAPVADAAPADASRPDAAAPGPCNPLMPAGCGELCNQTSPLQGECVPVCDGVNLCTKDVDCELRPAPTGCPDETPICCEDPTRTYRICADRSIGGLWTCP
jgi:hypothetical protein